MIEDLHVHSTMSDGSDTFEQVLEQAAQRGVERLAFTNHDTTAGLTAARELGERLGVQVVGGIEVSAYDFERGRKVHILGLGIEEGAPALAALCGPTLERRHANSLWQLDRLVEAGYEVDVERALELGRASTCLYKQHLMAALTSEPYPSAGYRTLYRSLFKDGGICDRDIDYVDARDADTSSTAWVRAKRRQAEAMRAREKTPLGSGAFGEVDEGSRVMATSVARRRTAYNRQSARTPARTRSRSRGAGRGRVDAERAIAGTERSVRRAASQADSAGLRTQRHAP